MAVWVGRHEVRMEFSFDETESKSWRKRRRRAAT